MSTAGLRSSTFAAWLFRSADQPQVRLGGHAPVGLALTLSLGIVNRIWNHLNLLPSNMDGNTLNTVGRVLLYNELDLS